MYEDDRIRHKNHAHIVGYGIFTELRSKYWSHNDIEAYAHEQLEKDPTNKAMYEVLKMAVAGVLTETTSVGEV